MSAVLTGAKSAGLPYGHGEESEQQGSGLMASEAEPVVVGRDAGYEPGCADEQEHGADHRRDAPVAHPGRVPARASGGRATSAKGAGHSFLSVSWASPAAFSMVLGSSVVP